MKDRLKQFRELLKEEKFFQAHEVLEEVWFPRRFEENNEIKLLKGLINGAVSFELLKRGRVVQSNKVWANYLKYRTLLYKIVSKDYNEYHKTVRKLDFLRKNKV